jgi:DNA polymerase-1
MKPCLFAFDINSHFARIYTSLTKDGVIPDGPDAFFAGKPVFCLKPLLNLVNNEIRAMASRGIGYSHIVLVFDAPGKNFRHRLDPNYKGTRPPKPDEWRIQEALMYDMFKALGFPCLRIDDVEADDVLATLAINLGLKGVDVVLFTGDKDIMSLCTESVSVYAGCLKKWLRKKDVEDKFGIPVERLLDYLAMTGDVIDNVSGVPNIGPKRAASILNEMSMAEMLEQPRRILELGLKGCKGIVSWLSDGNNIEKAKMSRMLVDLKTDVELGFKNLNEMRKKQPQHDGFLHGYMRPDM